MIASSATAGQPGRPSTPDNAPSCMCAPAASRGSCACWAMTPSNALTYSSARRISTASCDAAAVVGEHPHAEPPSRPSRRARRAARRRSPTVTAPTGCTSHQAGLAAEPPDLLDDRGGVGDRVGVGHRDHGGEAAERRGPRSRSRSSRRPRGRARAGACAGRRGPGSATSPSASTTRRRRPAAVPGADLGDRHRRAPARRAASPRRASRAPSSTRSVVMPLAVASPAPSRSTRRAAVEHGHADATRRWRPARRSPSGRESATSAAISSPRFIGPGCITIACSGFSAGRSASRP